FYCLGFFLLATAPEGRPREDNLPTSSITPIGGGGGLVTATQQATLSLTLTFGALPPPLFPTPIQSFPPATVFLPPTATQFIFISSSTFAPTLTFPPTFTPQPTNTTEIILPPTNTNVPALPTNTDVPVATAVTNEAPPDVILPPTDTPTP